MIKNTNSSCIIKDINVSSNNANIILIITSQKDQTINLPFKFYLQDYDSNDSQLLSDTVYYIDRIAGWIGDSSVVNVNKYATIHFKIDITNQNTSAIKELKWYRKCRFILKNINDMSIAWKSEWIELLSKEIEIPAISNLDIYTLLTNSQYTTTIKFKYKYNSDQNFNYNNLHLHTDINIYSVATNNLIESANVIEEDELTSKVEYTLQTHTKENIYIDLLLMTSNNNLVLKKTIHYTPVIRQTNSWYVSNGKAKKVMYIYAINT